MSENMLNQIFGNQEDVSPVNEPVENVEDSGEEKAPLSVTQYQPLSDQTVLAEITPAMFDGFLKVLKLVVGDMKGNEAVMINKSVITQDVKGAIITADLKPIFNDLEIDLHIVNPKKYFRLLKNFKSNNNIYIIDDDENARYLFNNGEIRLFLPKKASTDNTSKIEIPDLSDVEVLCQKEIDKDSRDIIVNLAGDSDYVEYLIQDDELKGIHIPDTAVYIFNEYLNDPKTANLDETNAELTLRSIVYMPVEANSYKVYLCKKKGDDDSYIAYTECDAGFLKIGVYEILERVTGGNILI